MTESSTPKRLEELAAGYVVGNLDLEEAEEFRQLLQENPELVTQVNLLEDVLGTVERQSAGNSFRQTFCACRPLMMYQA